VSPPNLTTGAKWRARQNEAIQGLTEGRVRSGEPTTVRSGPARIFLDGDEFAGTQLPTLPDELAVTDREWIRSTLDRKDGSTAAIAR
jgi:hypothetical protein